MSDTETTSKPSVARTFYHGTKAELKPGDMLQGGHSSNYTERRSPWIARFFRHALRLEKYAERLARN
ncbi:MAG: NAD(+)--rifampin ADP-ribosyltransferase [Acidobacteriota bacterium]